MRLYSKRAVEGRISLRSDPTQMNLDGKIKGHLDHLAGKGLSIDGYVDRAKRYSNECGCAMGGTFVIITTVMCIAYHVIFSKHHIISDYKAALMTFIVIVLSAVSGKVVGIGVARLKLLLLYYELKRLVKH